MKFRDGKYGKFYGCTAYPKCKNTTNLREAELDLVDDYDDYEDYDDLRWDR